MSEANNFSSAANARKLAYSLGQLARGDPQLRESTAALIKAMGIGAPGAGTAAIDGKKFGIGPIPEEPTPRFYAMTKPICTAGNLTSITAQAKAGKTAMVGAFLAAILAPETNQVCPTCDTLGITVDPAARGMNVLHFDTEQSEWDHHRLLVRSGQRVGLTLPAQRPEWLHSWPTTRLSPEETREFILAKVQQYKAEPGIHSIIIDGVGDLVTDVNDAAECNEVVAELHGLAIELKCPIIVVLHENPAIKGGGKPRGHLGSQLERKAETNIRLERTGELTHVYADKNRGAPLLRSDGLAFKWSDPSGRHILVPVVPGTPAGLAGQSAKAQKKVKKLTEWAELCLAAGPLSYSELVAKLKVNSGHGQTWAENTIAEMKAAALIVKTGDTYSLPT